MNQQELAKVEPISREVSGEKSVNELVDLLVEAKTGQSWVDEIELTEAEIRAKGIQPGGGWRVFVVSVL